MLFIGRGADMLEHPGKLLAEQLEKLGYTQKAFSQLLGKKVSEINELIKGKRNITIAWDILLSQALGTPKKFWVHQQIDYDYQQALENLGASSGEEMITVGHSSSPIQSGGFHQDENKEIIPENIEAQKQGEKKDHTSLMTQVFESF